MFFLLALLCYAVMAVLHKRFLIEATLVATGALVAHLPALRSRWLGPGLGILMLVAAACGSARIFGFGLDPARFPAAAVAYLKEAHPPGPLFNSYNFGGYLLWAYPEERVFIDGRAFTVYSPEHIRAFLAVYEQPERFRDLQARYGLRLAVLQRSGRGRALVEWLGRQPDWHLAHADDLAVVLVRD